jgi:LAO/AO transport system kinase
MEASNLARRLLDGDRRALARAITLVQDDDPAGWALVGEVYPQTGRATIVGITGPPGSGKSTLIGALTRRRRAAGRSVAVLSVDPTSPFSGGAVLGDRIRLTEHFLDSGVFIRSMASRGALGGLAEAALQAALLMDAAGKDDIFLETVGVGQTEVDVIDHADTVVLVLTGGAGDSVQALKAGILEVPDVIVVNKADNALSGATVRDIRGVMALAAPDAWRVPILETEASADRGVTAVVEQLDAHRAWLADGDELAARRARRLQAEVLALATARIRRELDAQLSHNSELQRLLADVTARRLDPASAARQIAAAVAAPPPPPRV